MGECVPKKQGCSAQVHHCWLVLHGFNRLPPHDKGLSFHLMEMFTAYWSRFTEMCSSLLVQSGASQGNMPEGMIRTKRTECWISPSLTVRHSSSEPVMRPVILHHLLLKLCMVLMCQERKKAKQSLHGAPHCGPMKTTREPDLPVGL